MKIFNDAKLAFKARYLFGVLLCLFALPLWIMSIMGCDTFYYTIPLVCLMQIYLIARLKQAQMLLIITLYVFLYFSYLIPYFYYGSILSEHSEFQDYALFCQVLFLFYLFYSGLTLAVAVDINPNNIRLCNKIKIECEPWKQSLFICFLLFIFIKVINQGESVLAAANPYQVYMDNLKSNSALPLFLLLFMFFAYYVISNKTVRNIIYTILFCGILFYCVTRGYRVLIAPLGFLFFLLFLDGRLKVKWIVAGVVATFVCMFAINAIKMGNDFELEKLFSEHDEFILSHHADNLYVSAAAIGLVDNGSIDFIDRIMLNVGFFSESVIPATFLPLDMKYPLIISTRTTNGGGGLCLAGAYIMWGYLGVLIFGYLLARLVQLSYVYKSEQYKIIVLIILLYSANWFSYDFHVILRFPVFALVIYFLLKYTRIKLPYVKKYSNS